jgi:hypothetical protein
MPRRLSEDAEAKIFFVRLPPNGRKFSVPETLLKINIRLF